MVGRSEFQLLDELGLEKVPPEALAAYCQGALHDGTFSSRHRTHRIGQAEIGWLHVLQAVLKELGYRSWMYREGRRRNLWVLETTACFLSKAFVASALLGNAEGVDYVRGYFDAEGGMPRECRARLYFQFVQKDRRSLEVVAGILENIGIKCGEIHNPSRAIDPEYWRFFVRAESHQRFITAVGSWHPRKRLQMAERARSDSE